MGLLEEGGDGAEAALERRVIARAEVAEALAPAAETDYAHDLVGHLTSDMLLLADRAFDSNELLADIAALGLSS